MKKLVVLYSMTFLIYACGGQGGSQASSETASNESTEVNDGKGIGEIKSVTLNNPLDEEMIKRGKSISEMKCLACHKLSDQRVVGPGWQGITDKRKPEWIMNMITNVDVMLAEDPVARELLKQCLTRMPNQNLSIGDARDVLEFMYANDQATASE